MRRRQPMTPGRRANMACEALPDGNSADFGVKVEDAGSPEIYRAGLSFTAWDKDDIDSGKRNLPEKTDGRTLLGSR